MEFDTATARLARDQSKLRDRRRRTKQQQNAISARAARQAEYQKQQQARFRAERERKKRDEAHRLRCLHECQRLLKEKSLAPPNASSSLLLKPTSIHGNGDKLALPPSVLQALSSDRYGSDAMLLGGNPWTFRIGVLNPGYEFPASPLFRVLTAKARMDDDHDDNDDHDMNDDHEDEDAMDDDEDMDDNDEDEKNRLYLDELNHKYLAYTHCTVVEFTQEEGHVGIPRHIAQALLDPQNQQQRQQQQQQQQPQHGATEIPRTITVDPAAAASASALAAGKYDDNNNNDDDDNNNNNNAMKTDDGMEQTRTPGHLAWGAFEIPDALLEITMVQLPKGTGCTLVPTKEAIQNRFYALKDVKLVLEQSLIRTRATLSRGDKVSTWHRGTEFLLTVTKVVPSSFQAVTCINTDIEVEIGEPTDTNTNASTSTSQNETTPINDNTNAATTRVDPETKTAPTKTPNNVSGFRLGTGQSIASSTPKSTSTSSSSDAKRMDDARASPVTLLAEPPAEQKEGVCTVQIRCSGGHGKRRFAIETARVKDLFAFAASVVNRNEQNFRLVTRFPRREFNQSGATELTLVQAGIQQGQEMFMMEDL
uniref:UBX domain-containing protein n=1 Tax=Pseudo-nitzschia australis TaxID=44445 RepID=A0A7S4AIS9_9STRA